MAIAYAPNKDLLKEIHTSKISFCHYVDDVYTYHDFVTDDLSSITEEVLTQIRFDKVYNSIPNQWHRKMLKEGKLQSFLDAVPISSIVIRLMTYDHIPLRTDDERKSKSAYTSTSFEPFKHYVYSDGLWLEVLRSHWTGGFDNGIFVDNHGTLSRELVRLLMLMVDKYGHKSNWNQYSYLDEMKDMAIEALIGNRKVLRFDENKSDNPFAYCTSIISNMFKRVWNIEHEQQSLRDDLLQSYGRSASYTRMAEDK